MCCYLTRTGWAGTPGQAGATCQTGATCQAAWQIAAERRWPPGRGEGGRRATAMGDDRPTCHLPRTATPRSLAPLDTAALSPYTSLQTGPGAPSLLARPT